MSFENLLNISQKFSFYIVAFLIILGTILTIITAKQLKKRKLAHKWRMPAAVIYAFIWFTILLLSLLFLFPSIHKIKFFENQTLLIDSIKVWTVIYIIFGASFLSRLLKWHFVWRNSKNNRTLYFLSIFILWILITSLILDIILKHPDKVFKFKIFSISKVEITVADIIYLLIIVGITQIITIFLKNFFERLTRQGYLEEGKTVVLYKLSTYVLWTISLVLAIEAMGFNITLIIAGSAALLVGFGMGIQQLFLDFVSGLILLTERNISIGDVIEVNGIVGKIVDLKFRTTVIVTRDNVRIIIPNSKLTSDSIINWTHSEKDTRFNVKIGVAYGSDVEKVIKILLKVANEHPLIKKQPKPFVRFEDFADSALIFSLFFFTDDNFYVENIKSDLRIAIDKEFRKENITIPFPQMDVHIDKKD